MFKNNLVCYPGTPCETVQSLQAAVERLLDGSLRLRYALRGDMAQLRIPAPQPPAAVDNLWEHTCFEAFIAVEGTPAYREFNFSPAGTWATYAFSAYRVRSAWTPGQAPRIHVAQTHAHLLLEAVISADALPPNRTARPLQLGLTAVLETNFGSRSYWALRHPAAKPDFHLRTGFVLSLNPIELDKDL
ncbi:MAG: DOMON-like domain-containing protein [Gammaproteobacteria bacterium]